MKKTDATANAITLTASGAEKIDNSTTQSLSGQYNTYEIICDGTKWNVITSPSTSPVTSVAGKSGAVTLVIADITDWPGFGTSGGNAVKLTGGKLPAVDGSNLTNLAAGFTATNGKLVTGSITKQWGITSTGGSSGSVTYGTALSAAAYSIQMTQIYPGATGNVHINSSDGNGFGYFCAAGGVSFYWEATGPT